MGVPLIASSARKHGIADDDMTHAFDNPIPVDELEDGLTMFIGGTGRETFSRSACSTAGTVPSSSTPCQLAPTT